MEAAAAATSATSCGPTKKTSSGLETAVPGLRRLPTAASESPDLPGWLAKPDGVPVFMAWGPSPAQRQDRFGGHGPAGQQPAGIGDAARIETQFGHQFSPFPVLDEAVWQA